MTQKCHTPETGPTTEPLDVASVTILDAASALIVERSSVAITVAEISRASGLSRMTIYRRYADADAVVRAALTERVHAIMERIGVPDARLGRVGIARAVSDFTTAFLSDAVFGALVMHEPESFTRYTLSRLGRSQRSTLHWLASAIVRAQSAGGADDVAVREGAPDAMAVMLMLIAQSSMLSRQTVRGLIDDASLNRELTHAIESYLRP